MKQEYWFSYGRTLPHNFSNYRPDSRQRTVGLPNPIISNNVGRIAMIGYLNIDNRNSQTQLIGFLPYEQAKRVLDEKSGDTYWWIILSVPSIDIAQDFKALQYRYSYVKHPTLPNLYEVDHNTMRFLLEWVEGANQAIGAKTLYDEIEKLQSEQLQHTSNANAKAYEKHLEKKELENIGLQAEVKRLKEELSEAKWEISNLQSKLNPKDTKGYVYLLKMVKGDYWKIGRTAKPKQRMDRFDVKLPFEVQCEHLIQTDDMYQLEQELHQRFAKQRTGGEWFALSQSDIDYIKGL